MRGPRDGVDVGIGYGVQTFRFIQVGFEIRMTFEQVMRISNHPHPLCAQKQKSPAANCRAFSMWRS